MLSSPVVSGKHCLAAALHNLQLSLSVMMVFEFWEEGHDMDVPFRLKHPSFLFSVL